jgi:hypothetical protein
MAETTYSYTLSTDFPSGQINAEKLENEIYASAITRSLSRIDVNNGGDSVDVVFNDALTAGDKTILDNDTTGPAGGLIAAHDNSATIVPEKVEITNVGLTSASYMKVEVEPREGTGKNFYTPNFCDQTTWYEGATAVSEFSMTDSGDLTTWNTNGTHPGPWVDLVHGKIFAEDLLTAADATLLCVVEVSTDGGTNWTTKTENTFDQTDGDHSVDYANGTVTFNSALGGSDQVRASFSKAASTMTYTLKPDAGKRVRLIHVEAQIAKDVGVTGNVEYQVWAYNPFDLPNKVMVKKSVYKTLNDFLYESTGVYPVFPALDVSNPRGIPQDIVVVPFNYTASRDVVDSQGIEIRVVLNTPFTGFVCNSTFYCLEEDE